MCVGIYWNLFDIIYHKKKNFLYTTQLYQPSSGKILEFCDESHFFFFNIENSCSITLKLIPTKKKDIFCPFISSKCLRIFSRTIVHIRIPPAISFIHLAEYQFIASAYSNLSAICKFDSLEFLVNEPMSCCDWKKKKTKINK